MKGSVTVCSYILLCSITVLAELGGSDDFDDNVRDPAKWVPFESHPGLLIETNEHVEFVSTGAGQERSQWIWSLNTASYTQDWFFVVDAANTCNPSTSSARIAIGVANSHDFNDTFSAELTTLIPGGLWASGGWSTDSTSYWNVAIHPVSTNAIQLKIAFDSATKVLTSSFDSGSGFTSLTNFHVSSWAMTDMDTFSVGIDGMSFSYAVAPGELYADNFRAVTFFGMAEASIHSAVEIGWYADPGVAYQVQYCTDLLISNWTDFESVFIGNGATNYIFDSARTGPKRFYRIRASTPP